MKFQAQNRDKMIKYTCLAGIGALGLQAFGIAGLINKEQGSVENHKAQWLKKHGMLKQ